ncbi:MAG: FAD-dependent oxidoreductase [Streptosporangiales bacterium]|nr:FAD-dependent oxidoreductase [Streptosporangiales bacterium]
MTTRPPVDALVIGAGVIGLATAITFAEAGHRVLVRTAEPLEQTTSAVAGALWGPWMAEPADRAMTWAAHTLTFLTDLAGRPGTGVRVATGTDVSNVEHEPPEWFSLLRGLRPCHGDELPPGYAHGNRYTAPLVDMPVHLRYLANRLHAAGGEIAVESVDTIEDAADLALLIINCAGLGARNLASDTQLYPVRGQHVVVTNPGITDFLEVDTADSPDLVAIYPHGDHVVLGGTAEPHRWDRTPDPVTAAAILKRCTALDPRLRDAEIIEHRVGLRPTRPQVRLELGQGPSGSIVVHNYGHGGAGVSLSWGCAAKAFTLVSQL